MSEQATAWPPGTVLAGRYRVDEELGRGGMGVVLRAWPLVPSVQLRTDTPIALKLMLNTGGRIDQQRFEREARITAELDPTGVCAIYDAGLLDDGTPFIAMELLEGEDLDDRLAREGSLPPVEAVDLLLAAIDILAEAHLAGLVHRDLKPSNLFLAVTPLGPQLKVLDFGIVKVLQGPHQTSVLTQTGEILGSPAYMAPEQLMDSGRVDHRIDIWAPRRDSLRAALWPSPIRWPKPHRPLPSGVHRRAASPSAVRPPRRDHLALPRQERRRPLP